MFPPKNLYMVTQKLTLMCLWPSSVLPFHNQVLVADTDWWRGCLQGEPLDGRVGWGCRGTVQRVQFCAQPWWRLTGAGTSACICALLKLLCDIVNMQLLLYTPAPAPLRCQARVVEQHLRVLHLSPECYQHLGLCASGWAWSWVPRYLAGPVSPW